jgi:hypothetical protein
MVPLDSSDHRLATVNGCQTVPTGEFARLTLNIPVGAAITDITASVLDSPSANPYYLTVIRFEQMGNQIARTTVATSTRGTPTLATLIRSRNITPPSETVDPGEHFAVEFDDGESVVFGNGLCSVSVTFQLPAS